MYRRCKLSMTSGYLMFFLLFTVIFNGIAFGDANPKKEISIIFLHHSTGRGVWKGGIPQWMADYNTKNNSNYNIEEKNFPTGQQYKWKNYPYDYWNIWVRHQGNSPYMGEPTLEILTKTYNVVIWKHCFPVSDILPDTGTPDIASPKKRKENYIEQYEALKEKMLQFPETKFIVWTGAALLETNIDISKAKRAKSFFDWVRNTWDEKGDNIFIWDFWELQTEGGFFLKPEFAASPKNPHPNKRFNRKVAPLAAKRVVDVIEGRGDIANITGRD